MSAGAVRPDHYATLGVAPDASPAEVRAAYVAHLREYHPDRNPSPEAVDRTKAIIAAFKVIGDFDQRSYYDWDRRRDREAAESATLTIPRRRTRAALAAGGIGVAAISAWLLLPRPHQAPSATAPLTVADGPVQDTARSVRSAAMGPPPAPLQSQPTVLRAKTAPAEPGADAGEERVVGNEKPKPVKRIASVDADPPRRKRGVDEPTVSVPVRTAATRSSSDIAQLDQFVMNFYGQSWRYGDAPKRAVLEKTRASFVARRGACSGDDCRRNAYLDLMRDVSSIVETGKPEPR